MRHTTFVGLIPLLLLLVTGEASAHALLDRAEPRVGNSVATAPREVTLWFTQKLEPACSTIPVTNAAGQRVDTGKARISGNQMSISVRPGGTGTYRVNWHVLSVDTIRPTAISRFRLVRKAVEQPDGLAGRWRERSIGDRSRSALRRHRDDCRNP